MTKTVWVEMDTNDNGSSLGAEAQMEDDGVTIKLPAGVLPGIDSCQAGWIRIRTTTVTEPVSASVVVDEDTGEQTVTFVMP